MQNKEKLRELEGDSYKLEVRIDVIEHENRITILDNAAGISEKDYERAFRTADAPPDRTNLSEFGMGMKAASCWFCNKWEVTTKAIGEDFEKRVNFDLAKISDENPEEIEVLKRPVVHGAHYTMVDLRDVHRMPTAGRTKGKVKDHLTSIYREFIRKGELRLFFNNEELKFKDPKILKAPRWDDPKGNPIEWKVRFQFNPGSGKSVHGFVAIRETGSTSEAGFTLFRRGRVVEGSLDNGFKPDSIFLQPNSFRSQRIFGELHLDGFDVNFTKKGIQRDESFENFVSKLKEYLGSANFPMLKQADNYRARATEADLKSIGKKAFDEVKFAEPETDTAVGGLPPELLSTQSLRPVETDKKIRKTYKIRANGEDWEVSVELTYDEIVPRLVEVMNPEESDGIRKITVRLSLVHEFMRKYDLSVDSSRLAPVLHLFAMLGLSEILAIESGNKCIPEVRYNLNAFMANL